MSRKRRRIRANRARRMVDLDEVYAWIERINTPPGGWRSATPVEAEIAKEKIYVAKKAANRVYNLQNTHANFQRAPGGITPQQRQQIYREGYNAAEAAYQERVQELQRREAALQRRPQQHMMATAQQLERARMDGYAQGIVAGRALARQEQLAANQPRPEDIARIRQEMREAMLEECRVISESNPNMAPGVNAVRHRIRKL